MKGRINVFLDEKMQAGLSARTVNHIPGFLSRTFSPALERERWNGKNPLAGMKRRQRPNRLADLPRFEEGGPVIQIPSQHFHRFVTTPYTGLRKGELRALRKLTAFGEAWVPLRVPQMAGVLPACKPSTRGRAA